MTRTTVREIQGEEMLDAFYGLDAYAFRASPPLPGRTEWEEVVTEREGVTYLALFEAGTAASVAAVSPWNLPFVPRWDGWST